MDRAGQGWPFSGGHILQKTEHGCGPGTGTRRSARSREQPSLPRYENIHLYRSAVMHCFFKKKKKSVVFCFLSSFQEKKRKVTFSL